MSIVDHILVTDRSSILLEVYVKIELVKGYQSLNFGVVSKKSECLEDIYFYVCFCSLYCIGKEMFRIRETGAYL